MIKFFVPKEDILGDKIYLTSKDDVKHLVKVLRSRVGDSVVISDMEAMEYQTEIAEIGDMEVVLKVLESHPFENEPATQVTLYQGVPKGPKLETVVQKTVELGVDRVVPVFMARTVVADKGNFSKKVARLQKIADEAVKQCKRDRIPEVSEPLDFKGMMQEIRREDYDAILIPYESKEGYTIKDALRFTDDVKLKKGSHIALIIGPEGGFEDSEIEALQDEFDRKAQVVTLGKIIMRTETAGMAALAMIMYELEL